MMLKVLVVVCEIEKRAMASVSKMCTHHCFLQFDESMKKNTEIHTHSYI